MFRTRTRVGVYVDDAPGSVARAAAIVPHLRSQVTVLSTTDLQGVAFGREMLLLQLPAAGKRERDPRQDTVAGIPPSIGSAAATELVAWVEQESPDLLFVDAPSDVALFARLAGVRVVLLQRHGRRTAAQRQIMNRAALGKLAPYPHDLAPVDEPVDHGAVHAGFLSRFAGRDRDRSAARSVVGVADPDRLVTVLGGRQSLGLTDETLAAAAAATPGWRWHVLGATDATGERDGAPDDAQVRQLGWVQDPWSHLVAADVVISGASPSVVAEVADAGAPLVVIPRRTADREERRFADALGRVGAAVPVRGWPAPARWSATLDAAARMDTRPLVSRRDGGAARRAAEWLDTWAAMPSRTGEPVDAAAIGRHLGTAATGASRTPEPST